MKKFQIALFLGFAALGSVGNSLASDEKRGVSGDFAAASPSGAEFVFSADYDGPTRLWAAAVDGRNLRKLSKTDRALTSIAESEPA